MKPILLSAVLFSLVLTSFAEEEIPSIEVTGTATGKGDVDRVIWRFTIRGEADSLEEAGAEMDGATEALRNRIGALEIGEEGMRFSRTRSGRVYEQGPNRARVFKGYYAERGGRILLEDLEKSGGVEAALLADDGVEIQGLQLESSEYEELKQQAGVDAVEAAREKAVLMTGVLGVELGDVLLIREGAAGFAPRLTENRIEMPVFAQGGSDSYEQVEVTVTVTLRFEVVNGE